MPGEPVAVPVLPGVHLLVALGPTATGTTGGASCPGTQLPSPTPTGTSTPGPLLPGNCPSGTLGWGSHRGSAGPSLAPTSPWPVMVMSIKATASISGPSSLSTLVSTKRRGGAPTGHLGPPANTRAPDPWGHCTVPGPREALEGPLA